MPKAITHGIQVEVEVFYRPDRSDPRIPHHFYEYLIHIKNKSTEKVKLINRRWMILESPAIKRIVEGEGVIGEQPELDPGHSHSYSSFCVIHDTVGYMKGIYVFEKMETGKEFQVTIPLLKLILPAVLN